MPLSCFTLKNIMRFPAWFLTSLVFVAATANSFAQPPAPEARAAQAYQAAAQAGPTALRAFLVDFPKGADLHVHLSGAVYAETFIRDAGDESLCVDPAALKFAQPPCSPPLSPAVQTPANQQLYNQLIDVFSMRDFVPTTQFSGHDHFFATFSHFGGLSGSHLGEWVDEVASRSASQNQQYLELMETPEHSHATAIAQQAAWPLDPTPAKFAQLRQKLLTLGLRNEVGTDRDEVRNVEKDRLQIERCGTPQAAPACRVEVRYIYQILRGFPPQQVFAQTLLGFETIQATMAAHESGFVGLNFVMPEDGAVSMRDYTLQMKMLDYLHSVYPQVPISLHAGELVAGLVPNAGLRFHIRQAVELGHAERIGHGVDLRDEDDYPSLLKEMAAKHIMVEINLSSNEGILNVSGAAHPFPLYRAAHVPVALSTDDEGVSRIDLTHEYVRAALEFHLNYSDLKQLARTGLEHSFLPGASLWAALDEFTAVNGACKGEELGGDKPSAACKTFLDASEKAAQQWELERRMGAFEAKF